MFPVPAETVVGGIPKEYVGPPDGEKVARADTVIIC